MKVSFDVGIAIEEGIEAACVYDTIDRTYKDNRALGRCRKDGKYWVAYPTASYRCFHPYLTEEQIEESLEKLTEDGLIVKGNFKVCGWDTYTITEEG